MTKQYLPIIAYMCGFLLGCLLAGVGINGIRHGQLKYGRHWFNKREDGIFLWLLAGFLILVGGLMAFCSVSLTLEYAGKYL